MLNYSDLDWKLIGAALALSLIGVLLIMSAQHFAESEYAREYYQRQLLWLAVALVFFVAVIHLPLRLFDLSAYLLYGIAVILLILVLMVGSARMGASRWFAFGPVSLAPSDIAKIALVFTLARFFAYSKRPPTSKRRLAISAILTVIPIMLILKQPDLGTSLVFFFILFVLWFWSGLSPWYLLMILSPLASLVTASYWWSWALYFVVLLTFLGIVRPGILFSVTVVVANLAFGIVTPIVWNRLAEYQRLRILTFINPEMDPRGAGYQIIQSKIAIGSGGIWGKGFLNGSQSRLEFLPERHTDFIFSVLGEEFGLWGALIVLGLFGFILVRSIRIAARCRSRFASHVVMGAASIIIFQMLVNIGMTLGFMPVTGLPLPFVSYGGTGLVLTWTLVALIVSADYHWQEY
ncbi:MAG: rod shape-determining protein RodA [candidate division Zixibacteria bacterium]|jgi:rod shape determining protein RodA|nr:rod shape-determining protein RodA [candidate division Zixibacteria bacterium]